MRIRALYRERKWSGIASYACLIHSKFSWSGPGAFREEEVVMALVSSVWVSVVQGRGLSVFSGSVVCASGGGGKSGWRNKLHFSWNVVAVVPSC